MNPLDLTPGQHAALYALARRRAHELRDRAIADVIGSAIGWLRSGFSARRTTTTATTAEGAPCRS